MSRIVQETALRPDLGHPHGSRWSIGDDQALADIVAQIALGQWRHLESILAAARVIQPALPVFASSARDLLLVRPGADPWHRDGWIFQCISWIAAAETDSGPLRPPHAILADKGFDGLQLIISRNGRRVKRLQIFEDKATSNPRKTVRDDVWPEFVLMENGTRNHELTSELSELLLRAPKVDRTQAVNRVFRERGLSYRVAITIADSHNTDVGIARLFKGYEDKVSGDSKRRYGHVLHVTDLRAWMQSIADLAIVELDRIESV